MSVPETIQIKVISSRDVIEELEKDFRKSPDQIRLVSSGPDDDPTSWQFGILEVAAIVTTMQGTFYLGELSLKIYKHLQKQKDAKRRIVVITPLGRAEFVASADLTEAQIKETLRRLANVHK
jgi:hypothetical protein